MRPRSLIWVPCKPTFQQMREYGGILKSLWACSEFGVRDSKAFAYLGDDVKKDRKSNVTNGREKQWIQKLLNFKS